MHVQAAHVASAAQKAPLAAAGSHAVCRPWAPAARTGFAAYAGLRRLECSSSTTTSSSWISPAVARSRALRPGKGRRLGLVCHAFGVRTGDLTLEGFKVLMGTQSQAQILGYYWMGE